MNRLVFIVEGQTEWEFVNISLRQYFVDEYDFNGIEVLCIQTSPGHKGGFTKYSHLKNDIKRSLKGDVIVTTFLDFFRIPDTVPGYEEMLKEHRIDRKLDILEKAMYHDFGDHRFVPYIQKHEFEALLFSDIRGFEECYENEVVLDEIERIINQFPNPEDINNHPETAPSKRLQAILETQGEIYDKVTEGNLIAEEIGFKTIISQCPRFGAWIQKLGGRIKT